MTVELIASEGNTIGVLLRGRLTEADYTEVLPEFDAALGQHEKLHVLMRIEEFQGWPSSAMTWMTKAFAGLTDTDLKFFREERLAGAWDRVRGRNKRQTREQSPRPAAWEAGGCWMPLQTYPFLYAGGYRGTHPCGG